MNPPHGTTHPGRNTHRSSFRCVAAPILEVVLLGTILSGCVSKKISQEIAPAGNPVGEDRNRNTPELVHPVIGKVKHVNTALRFVVLEFSVARMPVLDQRLNVYRGQERVGRVKVTGPFLETSVAADIVFGQAEAGDQVRAD